MEQAYVLVLPSIQGLHAVCVNANLMAGVRIKCVYAIKGLQVCVYH